MISNDIIWLKIYPNIKKIHCDLETTEVYTEWLMRFRHLYKVKKIADGIFFLSSLENVFTNERPIAIVCHKENFNIEIIRNGLLIYDYLYKLNVNFIMIKEILLTAYRGKESHMV